MAAAYTLYMNTLRPCNNLSLDTYAALVCKQADQWADAQASLFAALRPQALPVLPETRDVQSHVDLSRIVDDGASVPACAFARKVVAA